MTEQFLQKTDLRRKRKERLSFSIIEQGQRGVNNSLTCILSTTTPKGVVMEKMYTKAFGCVRTGCGISDR